MASVPYFAICRRLLDNVREERTERSLTEACFSLQLYSEEIETSCPVSEGTFSSQDYQEFIRTMLNEDWVKESSSMLSILYATLKDIIKALSPEHLESKIYTSRFVRFFGESFIRDTNKFQDISGLLMRVTYFFIVEIKSGETVSILKDVGFHSTVIRLFNSSRGIEEVMLNLEVLACLIDKHFEYLKDVKIFNEAKVPFILLEKILQYKSELIESFEESFKACYEAIMYMLTEDSDISKNLVKNDFMEQLLQAFRCVKGTSVRTGIVYSLGRLIDSTDEGKNKALDLQVDRLFFSTFEKEDNLEHQFIITCCEILKDLLLSDSIKHAYVQHGCMFALLRMLKSFEDIDVMYSVLNVIYGISDISLGNRNSVATRETLETLLPMIQKGDLTNVFLTILIFIQLGELDRTTVALRQLGLTEILTKSITNSNAFKKLSLMEENSMKLLEEQCLFTISCRACPGLEFSPVTSDKFIPFWPPNVASLSKDQSLGSVSSDSLTPGTISPIKDSFFKSNTPTSSKLFTASKLQLAALGIDTNMPIFHVGRLFGNTCHICKNCEEESTSSPGKFISYFIMRPHGLTCHQYQDLVDQGWYRTGNVEMLRMCHNHKATCYNWETRVIAKEFDHSQHRSFKKVLKRMPLDRLTVKKCRAHFNREAFDLYNDYQVKHHSKPKESEFSYTEHVINTPIMHQLIDGIECGTFHELYYLDGKLAAVSVYDVIPKGIISIYMWYNVSKEVSKYSFGKYTILKEIEKVKALSEMNPEMKYYYLQGWNGSNKKLSYKGDYEPAEFYSPCVVSNWVEGLDSVNQALQGLQEENERKENNVKESQEACEDIPPPTKKPKLETDQRSSPDQQASAAKQHFISQAFPLDYKRYLASCSESLEIGTVVICLNHSTFLTLGELLKHLNDDYQKEILETRIRDLYVALSPELRRQLVIDMILTS